MDHWFSQIDSSSRRVWASPWLFHLTWRRLPEAPPSNHRCMCQSDAKSSSTSPLKGVLFPPKSRQCPLFTSSRDCQVGCSRSESAHKSRRHIRSRGMRNKGMKVVLSSRLPLHGKFHEESAHRTTSPDTLPPTISSGSTLAAVFIVAAGFGLSRSIKIIFPPFTTSSSNYHGLMEG